MYTIEDVKCMIHKAERNDVKIKALSENDINKILKEANKPSSQNYLENEGLWPFVLRRIRA